MTRVWWGRVVRQLSTGKLHATYHARVYSDGSIQCWPGFDLRESFGWSRGGWEWAS